MAWLPVIPRIRVCFVCGSHNAVLLSLFITLLAIEYDS